MIATLFLITSIESVATRFSYEIYHLMAWVNDNSIVPFGSLLAFLADTESMLKACGSSIILFIVGFYSIKVNFLLFFYRLGNRVGRAFWIAWWIVLFIVLACGIASVTMGVPTFKCLFGSIEYTLTTCQTHGYENTFFTYFRVSVALDIFTDALSECIPRVFSLTNIRHLEMRQRLTIMFLFTRQSSHSQCGFFGAFESACVRRLPSVPSSPWSGSLSLQRCYAVLC